MVLFLPAPDPQPVNGGKPDPAEVKVFHDFFFENGPVLFEPGNPEFHLCGFKTGLP
jgi:hypothetical protein